MAHPPTLAPALRATPTAGGAAASPIAALLRIPIGADASPCDLLHETPLPRLDAAAAAEALTFAFASGDGDVLSRIVDATPVAASSFLPEDFQADLELERFVRQHMPVTVQGHRRPISTSYLLRVLSQPPLDRAHVAFRQDICAELASSPSLVERLESLYVNLEYFRARVSRPSVGRQDGIDRRLSILTAVRAVVESLAWDFAGSTSGLSRLHDYGQALGRGSGYRRLCELLEIENHRAEIDLRIVVGFDGRIRTLQPLEKRPNRSSSFYATPFGRAWTWLSLLVGGYRIGSGEVLSRLIDDVLSELERDVVFFFQLLGDLQVYLATLGFRRAALDLGLETCLPELRDGGSRSIEGLFRAPEIPRFGIPHVDRVAHGITYRIVVPGCYAIEVTVACPHRSCASLGNEESAPAMRNDVEPRRRRQLITAHANAIRAARVHTANPVVKEQVVRFHPIARTGRMRILHYDGKHG
jgi:DNA mismatch repair protein MutS2